MGLDPIILDGSHGEGGGQILRTALALSAITRRPFRIEKIRANRAKPGLMRQHLTCVNAAAAICGGKADGASVGSRELSFVPGQVRGGEYTFAVGSAGSTTLVMQTVLNLGVDPEVIFELIKLRAYRDNIWMQIHGANVLRRVDDGAARIEVNSSVVGWDDHQLFTQRIRNYTAKPIDVEVRRSFAGHVIFRSALQPTLHDFQTVQFAATVEPGRRADLKFELVIHQGRNAKQSNITLEDTPAQPVD